MGRPISIIKLTAEEEAELRRRVRTAQIHQRGSERARIVLLLSRGLTQTAVAPETGASLPCVNKWSQRFRRDRLAGLVDKPKLMSIVGYDCMGRPAAVRPALEFAQVQRTSRILQRHHGQGREFPDFWILSGDLYELEQALKQFMYEYNNIRPHKSLNYEMPVDWYNKQAA